MKESKFLPGWDKERARRILAHYEPETRENVVGPNMNYPAASRGVSSARKSNLRGKPRGIDPQRNE